MSCSPVAALHQTGSADKQTTWLLVQAAAASFKSIVEAVLSWQTLHNEALAADILQILNLHKVGTRRTHCHCKADCCHIMSWASATDHASHGTEFFLQIARGKCNMICCALQIWAATSLLDRCRQH